jgi:sulfonate transport system permease protein
MLRQVRQTFLRPLFVTWIVPLLILLTWQLVVQTGAIPARILPLPTSIVAKMVVMLRNGELIENTLISAERALIGLAIGGSIAFVLGLINGIFSTGEKLLDSTIQMVRTIPNLALVPLVILWFGIGETARIFLIAIGVFFPIYLNTFYGIRQVDRGLIEMAQSYGLTRWQLLRDVILPGALPSILVGLRYALGVMWLTLIIAETIAASSGIGYMTTEAREFMQTDVMVLSIIVYAVFGKLADLIARGLERRLLRWHPNYQTV